MRCGLHFRFTLSLRDVEELLAQINLSATRLCSRCARRQVRAGALRYGRMLPELPNLEGG